jgi:hypothetical protein
MIGEYPSNYVPIIRLYNSHILEPVDSFEVVASSLFGVQSQIFNASAIAFSLRTRQQTFSYLMHALAMLHLVRLWGIRATLHIYHKDDWSYLLTYLSTARNWYRTKLISKGIDIESIVADALDIIKGIDYFDRKYLISNGIDAKHLGAWGDLLIELNNRGNIFHYTEASSGNKLFGNTKIVLGKNLKIIENLAIVKKELASRYFRSYAPATLHDFAHWLGISIHESEEYLRLIADELISIKCGEKKYFIESNREKVFNQVFQRYEKDASYYVLSKFDPLLLAYHEKTWIIERKNHNRIWKSAGHVEGVVLQFGKAIAIWKYKLTNGLINFEVSPFRHRFSMKNVEKCYQKIARFFERSIGKITLTEEFL